MSLMNFLGWGNGNPTVDSQNDDRFKWEELPDLVKLEIFKYLDRNELNSLRQMSVSARYLIEYVHGLHVILPERIYKPAQCWLTLLYPLFKTTFYSRNITDSLILHILHQMERKKIFALEMNEMPPSFNPFPFSRFVQYPNFLRHVKLKYVDVDLINSVFTNCPNLTTFNYQTSNKRDLPRGLLAYVILQTSFSPVTRPATKDRLIEKINAFPPAPLYELTRLKDMCLTISKIILHFDSDWGNAIFMLVALPKLPSLTKLKFEFHPDIRLAWKTHFLILSCLGEFLSKTPSLQMLKYQSTFGWSEFLTEQHEFIRILCAVIKKFGSDTLKEVGDAADGPAPFHSFRFFVLATGIFNGAGRSLTHLRELEIGLKENNEHALFRSFIGLLQSPVLSVCKITDLKVTTLNPGLRLQRLFLLSHDQEPQNLAVYKTITELSVTFGRSGSLVWEIDHAQGYMVFNKTLANLPNLKVLNLKQDCLKAGNEMDEYDLHREVFGTTVHPIQDVNAFPKLEKLSLENFYIKNFVPEMLILFKNLKEFSFQQCDFPSFLSTFGISMENMLIVLSSLPKLDKVYVQPVITSLPNENKVQRNESVFQKAVDRKEALTRMGEMTELIGFPFTFLLPNEITREIFVGKFKFTFKPDP